MRKVLARAGKILVRDRKIVTGIDTSCCAGCGGVDVPCECAYVIFPECPGAEPSLCCSALQFDVITTIRAETRTTVDPSAWGLPLFGYAPIPAPAPTDGIMLDGYWEYENTMRVRCTPGNRRTIAHVGAFRWGANWYDDPGVMRVDSGERTWNVPPTDTGARIAAFAYGHLPGYDPIAGSWPVEAADAANALARIYPPLLATQGACVETYPVGSILTTVAPYVWAPINFAFGGTQVTGTGTTSANCSFRTSAMRFNWDFLGSGGASYGTSVQTWDSSDQTIVYEDCDADPCGGALGLL